MGMDPDNCDPVTLNLFRQKFLGKGDNKKEKLEEKKRKSKRNNKLDKFNKED